MTRVKSPHEARFCCNLTGLNTLWKARLQSKYHALNIEYGLPSSPNNSTTQDLSPTLFELTHPQRSSLCLYSSQHFRLGASNVHLAKVPKWIRRHDSWKSQLVQEKPSVRNSNMSEIQFGEVILANLMWKWCVLIFRWFCGLFCMSDMFQQVSNVLPFSDLTHNISFKLRSQHLSMAILPFAKILKRDQKRWSFHLKLGRSVPWRLATMYVKLCCFPGVMFTMTGKNQSCCKSLRCCAHHFLCPCKSVCPSFSSAESGHRGNDLCTVDRD